MEASLDTNVIIHLYRANLQHVLFNRFQKLKVYEFIRHHEMVNHAEQEIIELFDKDVVDDRIELITDRYLKSIGMHNVFLQHVKEHIILFGNGDLGEVYAIAMAKTLGCICLVTDDIKERGPHYTLMRIPDSEVMPFAFFELLLLDFLEGKMGEKELIDAFSSVCTASGFNWTVQLKLKGFIRRFWKDPYSESEKAWMKGFCTDKKINAKARIQQLWEYISKH